MTNWKTTAIGALGAGVIAIQSLVATGTITWQTAISAFVVAALGYFAKDAGVTGTGK